MNVGKVLCLGVVSVVLIASQPLSAQEPKLRTTLKGHSHVISSVAFSLDGKTLAVGAFDGTVQLWNVPSISSRDRSE